MNTNTASNLPGASPEAVTDTGNLIKVASWRRNSAEVVRVILDADRYYPTIAMHIFSFDEKGEERRTRGLTQSLRHIDDLVAAFTHVRAIAGDLGLLQGSAK